MVKTLLAIVIAILLIIGGVSLLKKDASEIQEATSVTENGWSVFQNDEYGYRLSYPGDTAPAFPTGNQNDPRAVTFELGEDENLVFRITSVDRQPGQTLTQWIDAEKSQRQAPQPAIQENMQIGGRDAYYLEYSLEDSVSFQVEPYIKITYYVAGSDYGYVISGVKIPENVNPDSAASYEANFETMLNSLEFLPV